MKTNPKLIGNAFERKICRLLSLNISKGERDDLFWRTPSSGAIGKSSAKFDGDIMLVDESGKYRFDWIVECKTTKKGSIIPLRSSVKEYLRQCIARYGDKQWLLILQLRGDGSIYIITPYMLASDYIASIEYRNITFFVYDFYKIHLDKIIEL